MTIAVIGSPTRTNARLAAAWRELGLDARVLWPRDALDTLGPGDTAIARLDVLPSLDGVEPGLELVDRLEKTGARVVNRPDALLATHDKLLTAARLDASGIPHPRSVHLEPDRPLPAVMLPCVLKPRFGSWGQDVFLCRSLEDVTQCLDLVSRRAWWGRHGAIVQELIEPVESDVRVVVAGDRAAAAARRIAAPGEWRTNVSLGGSIVDSELTADAEELAVRAVAAVGVEFVGVDLLPRADGWIVLELNGAVDFDDRYALPGRNPYAEILRGLGIEVPERAGTRMQGLAPSATASAPPTLAQVGDEIAVAGDWIGDSPRGALILEILGKPGHERFRVRWGDGHESIFFSGEGTAVRRPPRGAPTSTP